MQKFILLLNEIPDKPSNDTDFPYLYFNIAIRKRLNSILVKAIVPNILKFNCKGINASEIFLNKLFVLFYDPFLFLSF